MTNILSVYNEQLKEIFQVRSNPVLTIGGLKDRVALHYGLSAVDIAIVHNGIKY